MKIITHALLLLFFFYTQQSFGVPMKILVLYHSNTGGTHKLAKAIARGVQSFPDTNAILKSIKKIKISELSEYDGVAFGSPVYFGGMSGEMKQFLDQGLDLWKDQKLAGIPATVFMSSGSGLGKESAILNIWNVLASHGMIIVPTGPLPNAHTPFGVTALNGAVSAEEEKAAEHQGALLASVAIRLKRKIDHVELPDAPKAVGNYLPYRISGKHIYINQIALQNGKVKYPGTIGDNVTIDEAKEAARITALNVLAVLKEAVGGDFNKIKNAIQLTGYFKTSENFHDHSLLMNEVSDLVVKTLGEKGKHARAAIGAPSLPLNSTNEVQGIFEMK